MNEIPGELLRLVPIGLGYLRAIDGLKMDHDSSFVSFNHDGEGIPIGNVDDLGLEVGGMTQADLKKQNEEK